MHPGHHVVRTNGQRALVVESCVLDQSDVPQDCRQPVEPLEEVGTFGQGGDDFTNGELVLKSILRCPRQTCPDVVPLRNLRIELQRAF